MSEHHQQPEQHQQQQKPNPVEQRLNDHLQTHASLADHIHREIISTLHRRGIASIESLQNEVLTRSGQATLDAAPDPNQPEQAPWNEQQRILVEQIAREYAVKHFSVEQIDDIVNLAIKRDQVHGLEVLANRTNVTFRELADYIQSFCELPLGETKLQPADVVGTRVALTRHFISDQLEFLGVAKNYLTIRDFDNVTRRIIGSDDGMGRIGGKAGGMLLARSILLDADKNKEPFLPLAVPESYYLRSDVIEEFLRLNRLDEYQSQKYKPIEDVSREYPLIRGVFRNGAFPLKIVHRLREILKKLGTHPLIVRSSSLLEDRFGTGFCGKYASIFLANQGKLEDRLRSLLGAIAEVYASLLGPDPILYRKEHNLLDYVEDMAVLIQKVVGTQIGDYFLPAFAGVAFSRNEYRWSPRIKREDGLARIVVGLGTRAVDRSGSDYPRMIALGAPTLRPESNVNEILRCSQHNVDVIDFKKNKLCTMRLRDVFEATGQFPMLDKLVSVYKDDELYAPTSLHVDVETSQLCVTFDKLLRATPFTQRIQQILSRLENAYGFPVDMEFACDGQQLFLLQCRPLSDFGETSRVTIPNNIHSEDILFDAHKFIRTALAKDVEYILYVDPAAYDNLPTRQRRVALARAIGHVNRKLEPKSFVLIGPGRWGSNDVRLGVPVQYADINRCHVLIEVAREKGGFVPEVSFGTHFFQDLVEAGIHYLPLYPDESSNRFDESFMLNSPNALASLFPDLSDFQTELKVINVPAVAGGRKLQLAMDGESEHAVGYLA